jgi:curli biogenesis system outer membrane secretion channel CsgG
MLPSGHLIRNFVRLLALGGLAAPLAFAEVPKDEWKPYLEEKKGEQEFPDIKTMKDEKWLNVRYTEFAGFKPRLGVVLSEERRSGPEEYQNEWIRFFSSMQDRETATDGINNVETQVRQALNQTNRFTMVERTTALDDVIGEQDLGASGRVDNKTAPAIGKIRGADYTVKVEIIEIDPEKESKQIKAVGGGIGASTLGIGSIGVSGTVAWARVNVRVIRTETGVVVADMTVDGTAKEKGLGIRGGLIKGVTRGIVGGGGGFDSKKAASLSDALQVAANKAAYHAAMKLEDVPWEGLVSGVKDDGRITINAGTNIGLKTGLTLAILSKGEEVTDPESGESLGFETSEIGMARIVSVDEKFSTCEVVGGGGGAKPGDIVRLVKNGK